jgi:hypothetical protein
MVTDKTKGSLSAARRQLVELMQAMNFGRVEGLTVRSGEPVLDPLPRVVAEVKFCAENGPRPERNATDFPLKDQHLELFAYLDRLEDGHVALIEVKHGLPFKLEVVGPPG